MLHRHTYKGITWIDLVAPTRQEVAETAAEFGVDSLIAHELLAPTLQPRAEHLGEHLYLVLHFPALSASSSLSSHEQEVDFVIGKNVLITTRYEELQTLSEFRHVFSTHDPDNADTSVCETSFDMFALLARRLYKGVETEVNVVREKLEYIEKEIFEGYEKEMVVSLSYAGRDILNLKQALDPHQEILHSLVELTEKFDGKAAAQRMRSVENIYYRSRRHITRIWQTLNELRETNNSLLSTKQNEVMKTLTIMAFVTFPLMLISSIFGMNTHVLPLVGMRYDFWIITGLMGIATLAMFIFFKYRKWL